MDCQLYTVWFENLIHFSNSVQISFDIVSDKMFIDVRFVINVKKVVNFTASMFFLKTFERIATRNEKCSIFFVNDVFPLQDLYNVSKRQRNSCTHVEKILFCGRFFHRHVSCHGIDYALPRVIILIRVSYEKVSRIRRRKSPRNSEWSTGGEESNRAASSWNARRARRRGYKVRNKNI